MKYYFVKKKFYRLRGIGGDNNHPGPVEAMNRIRLLLLGKDPELIIKVMKVVKKSYRYMDCSRIFQHLKDNSFSSCDTKYISLI